MSDGAVLYAHRMGIDTYKQPIIFLRGDSDVCRAEGFETRTHIHVSLDNKFCIATLNMVGSDLLGENQIGLSEFTWQILEAKEGDVIKLSHPAPLDSLSHVRTKIYGNRLEHEELEAIIKDISHNLYSEVQLASFITACSGDNLDEKETLSLTQAMVDAGNTLKWGTEQIVDKHSVGGVPGNRTTLIIVPIVAAFGLTIPKTSSRAITSPAGSADTMEVLAPVQLNTEKIRKVVEQENGCIVWGGTANLSPADDILIRVERVLNLDSEGQLVASVLSKKVAAGSTHVLIDMPIGPTVKMRSLETANKIKTQFETIGKAMGLTLKVVFSDGTRPIGRGIGPALEAHDVLAVLQNKKDAPQDLRNQALTLAGHVLEFSPDVAPDSGLQIATDLLNSGKAWDKFQAICEAQGGLFEPPVAPYRHTIKATKAGIITSIDNRRLATIAKLAGAPRSKSAGIKLHVNTDTKVDKSQPLFTIHAEAQGELDYALSAIRSENDIMQINGE